MNQEVYEIIIRDELAPFIVSYPIHHRVLQDNASTYTSKLSMNVMKELNINLLRIPPFSPDINVIGKNLIY